MINLTYDEQGTNGHGSYDPRLEFIYARESGLGEKQGLITLTVTRLRSRDVRAAQLIRHSDKVPDTLAADALLVEPARRHLSVNIFSELATVPT